MASRPHSDLQRARMPLILAFLVGCIVGQALLTLYVLAMLRGAGL